MAVGVVSSGPLAWDRHSAVTHEVRNIASWATALCPSVVGHGDSRPDLAAYITLKFSRKCHNNSKKREGEEEKGVRRRWSRCEALPFFRLVRGNTLILNSLNCDNSKYIVLV
jgi:hypothetical protein